MAYQWDQTSVFNRLTARLKTKSDDQDILYYGNNARILDAVAEEFQEFARYDEYLTGEAKWSTARNYSSLLSHEAFYNYKARRKTGSAGYIKISTSSTFSGDYSVTIDIPKYSTFSNKDIMFSSSTARVLSSGQNYIELYCVQGTPLEYTFEITSGAYPNGTKYIELEIDNDSIENTVYDCYVNGIAWTEIDHIRLAESETSQVYVLDNKKDFSGVILKFGNDIFGKKLEIGDIVTFKCLETEGDEGNVLSANNITKVESSFTDANGDSVTIYCTNASTLIGGRSYEDKDDIKANAPLSFQTGGNVISRDDYETTIRETGLVDKVGVWGEKEVNEDLGNPPGTYIEAEENLVYISALTINPTTNLGTTITEAIKTSIRSELNDVKGPTDIVQFVDSQLIGVVFNTTAYIADKSYTAEEVSTNIVSTFESEYIVENLSYKQNLYFSDYYRAIDETAGVDRHRTTISFNWITTFDSAYVFDLELNVADIEPESVSIYVKGSNDDDWVLIAQDDGSTNIVGTPTDPNDDESAPYELPGAQIDYSNGSAGEIIVTYGLSESYSNYEIRVDFSVTGDNEGDLLLTKRQQIFYYYDSNITTVVEYTG